MARATQHHVVYVPGLGDKRSYGQDDAVNNWSKHGITGHYHAVGWADKEAFEPKLARLLAKIDSIASQGHKISLVGASAGASAVLHAYAKRPNINAVICIAGKINNPESIGGYTYGVNPAFKQAVFGLSAVLRELSPAQRAKIMSIHPLFDGTVPVKDTLIDGAVEKTIPVIGHRLAIFYSITLGSKTIANFIKSQNI